MKDTCLDTTIECIEVTSKIPSPGKMRKCNVRWNGMNVRRMANKKTIKVKEMSNRQQAPGNLKTNFHPVNHKRPHCYERIISYITATQR